MLEIEAEGNIRVWRVMVGRLLAQEVYPAVVQRLDLPGVMCDATCMDESITETVKIDLEIAYPRLEVELLMRNDGAVDAALDVVNWHRWQLELPPHDNAVQ